MTHASDGSVLSDEAWIAKVAAEMMLLDEGLAREHAKDFARDLAARLRWRAMAPEIAAKNAFEA